MSNAAQHCAFWRFAHDRVRLLKGDKFFCRDRALSIFIFSAEKEIALVSIEQYDPVRISKNKSAKFTSRISWP
jgi:hypothetical protein